MDRILRPSRFDVDPNDANAAKEWTHWFKTFANFLSALTEPNIDKLAVLTNYIAPSVYDCIAEVTTYEDAVSKLKEIYVKPKSEIFSRYLLQTRKQSPGESLDQFLLALKGLSKDCRQSWGLCLACVLMSSWVMILLEIILLWKLNSMDLRNH